MNVDESNGYASKGVSLASVMEMLPSFIGESFVGNLSSSEKSFLERLVQGHSYRQIAEGMNISINTVRDYVRSVYTKLGVNSRTQAVAKYLRTHLESVAPQPGGSAATMAETGARTIRSTLYRTAIFEMLSRPPKTFTP